MNNSRDEVKKHDKSDDLNSISSSPVVSAEAKGNKSLSMHDGVPVWYDCCSCEAEPYWAELAGDPESPESS